MQQIQMIERRERRASAIQPIARFEQRLIVGAAVVGDQHAKRRQVARKRVQKAGLFAVIAHEKLADMETFMRDSAHAHQERAGACAAGQACRLSVEKRPF